MVRCIPSGNCKGQIAVCSVSFVDKIVISHQITLRHLQRGLIDMKLKNPDPTLTARAPNTFKTLKTYIPYKQPVIKAEGWSHS